jgi:hypothetical protein
MNEKLGDLHNGLALKRVIVGRVVDPEGKFWNDFQDIPR